MTRVSPDLPDPGVYSVIWLSCLYNELFCVLTILLAPLHISLISGLTRYSPALPLSSEDVSCLQVALL